MSSRKTNALITISGRKGYVVRALRGSNEAGTIVATDADPMAPVRSADATFAHVPRVDAGDAYVSALLSIAARERIDCVVPVNDIDVCVLAQASDRFSQAGATVFVPPPEVTEILCDKLRAAQWLRDGGLETPETFDVETALRASGLSAPLIANRGAARAAAVSASLTTSLSWVLSIKTAWFNRSSRASISTWTLFAMVAETWWRSSRNTNSSRSMGRRHWSSRSKGPSSSRWRSASRRSRITSGRLMSMSSLPTTRSTSSRSTLDSAACFPFACHFCPGLAGAFLAIGRGESPPSLVGTTRVGLRGFREQHYELIES